MVLSQSGNIMVETSGQLVKPIPSPLENAERTLVNNLYDKEVGTKNDGNNNGDDHDITQLKNKIK